MDYYLTKISFLEPLTDSEWQKVQELGDKKKETYKKD